MSIFKKYNEMQVIHGCVDNDRRAQEALYRKYFPRMKSLVLRYTQDEDQLIQIVNDGFLKVFKRIQTFEGKGSLEGWIRRIVYHSLSDHFRKENRYLRFIVLEEQEKQMDHSVLDDMYYDDLLSLVAKLSDKRKEVFTLYAIEGYSHQEIAGRLHISEGTSKWYLSQARETLKNLLSSQLNQSYAG